MLAGVSSSIPRLSSDFWLTPERLAAVFSGMKDMSGVKGVKERLAVILMMHCPTIRVSEHLSKTIARLQR